MSAAQPPATPKLIASVAGGLSKRLGTTPARFAFCVTAAWAAPKTVVAVATVPATARRGPRPPALFASASMISSGMDPVPPPSSSLSSSVAPALSSRRP